MIRPGQRRLDQALRGVAPGDGLRPGSRGVRTRLAAYLVVQSWTWPGSLAFSPSAQGRFEPSARILSAAFSPGRADPGTRGVRRRSGSTSLPPGAGSRWRGVNPPQQGGAGLRDRRGDDAFAGDRPTLRRRQGRARVRACASARSAAARSGSDRASSLVSSKAGEPCSPRNLGTPAPEPTALGPKATEAGNGLLPGDVHPGGVERR